MLVGGLTALGRQNRLFKPLIKCKKRVFLLLAASVAALRATAILQPLATIQLVVSPPLQEPVITSCQALTLQKSNYKTIRYLVFDDLLPAYDGPANALSTVLLQMVCNRR